jgi:hypothetical protein
MIWSDLMREAILGYSSLECRQADGRGVLATFTSVCLVGLCERDATRLTSISTLPHPASNARLRCYCKHWTHSTTARPHTEFATMPSYEAKLLTDFLAAPASLRDFMTPRQFASIFPSAHRANPAIQELYRELSALRERDIDAVRQDIADEVRRSKQLKREYAHERRRMDTASVAGLDPVALQMEQEVYTCCPCASQAWSHACFSCPAPVTRH